MQIVKLGPKEAEPTDSPFILIKREESKIGHTYAVTWCAHEDMKGVTVGRWPEHIQDEATAIKIAHEVATQRAIPRIHLAS